MQGSLCRDGDAVFLHRGVMMLTRSLAHVLQASVHPWLISLQQPMLEPSPASRLYRHGSHAWAPLTAGASSIPIHQSPSGLSGGTGRAWREMRRTESTRLECGLVFDVLPYLGRCSAPQNLPT